MAGSTEDEERGSPEGAEDKDRLFLGYHAECEKWPFPPPSSEGYHLAFVSFFHRRQKAAGSGKKKEWVRFTAEVRNSRDHAVVCERIALGFHTGKPIAPPAHQEKVTKNKSRITFPKRELDGWHRLSFWVAFEVGGKHVEIPFSFILR